MASDNNYKPMLPLRHVENADPNKEEEYFPFSPAIKNAPFSGLAKVLLDAPCLVMKKLFCKTDLSRTDRQIIGHFRPLSVAQSEGEPEPNSFQEVCQWKSISYEDLQYAFGLEQTVPEGCFTRPMDLQDDVPLQPSITWAEPNKGAQNTTNARFPVSEGSARRLINGASNTIVFSGSHPENRALNRYHGCHRNIQRHYSSATRRYNRRNNKAMCLTNAQCVDLVSKVNLFDRLINNNEDVIYRFLVRFPIKKHPQLKEFVHNLLCQMQYKDDAESMINDIDNAGPGRIEIGARQMDSGLLMSLYDEVRSQLERGNFTFLKHSHRQTHEKKKLEEEGLPGPPLGNPSQVMAIALFCFHEMNAGNWTEGDIDNGDGVPIIDPGKSLRTCNTFLVACTPLCRSVGRSVSRSVCQSVGMSLKTRST